MARTPQPYFAYFHMFGAGSGASIRVEKQIGHILRCPMVETA